MTRLTGQARYIIEGDRLTLIHSDGSYIETHIQVPVRRSTDWVFSATGWRKNGYRIAIDDTGIFYLYGFDGHLVADYMTFVEAKAKAEQLMAIYSGR